MRLFGRARSYQVDLIISRTARVGHIDVTSTLFGLRRVGERSPAASAPVVKATGHGRKCGRLRRCHDRFEGQW
jgi:hypothetical protein